MCAYVYIYIYLFIYIYMCTCIRMIYTYAYSTNTLSYIYGYIVYRYDEFPQENPGLFKPSSKRYRSTWHARVSSIQIGNSDVLQGIAFKFVGCGSGWPNQESPDRHLNT